MNRKLVLALVIAGLVIAVLAVSPVFAARSLIAAAERGDVDALERQVDFPALRESLKDELNAELRREMGRRAAEADSALAGLGMMLAPTLMASAVDALVTPDGVAAMVRSGDAPRPEQGQPAPTAGDGDDVRQSYGYRDLNTFAITLTDRDHPDRPLSLLMTRRNLIGWKLSGVDLAGNDEPDELSP